MGPAVDTSLHRFLQEVFSCTAEIAHSIGRRVSDKRYPVRAVILNQGAHAGSTYLVAAGRAHALTYGIEGREVLLHEFLPGDFFGAIADAEPQPQNADIVAIEAVRAAVFLALDFLALIEAHSCVGLVVSKALLKQLRATSTRMLEQTFSAKGRIYAELLRLARLGDGRTIKPAPVHSVLAVHVHSTRETVSREINGLERRGIIRRERGALFIVAPQRLEELIV